MAAKSNYTVLLVEDEPGLAFVLSEFLQGYDPKNLPLEVVLAENGKQALEVLSKLPRLPDLILCDLSMPIMGGLEFLKAGKEKYGVLPVVMLSAHSDEVVREECRKFGVLDYLTKPYDLDKMAQQIPQWIGQGMPAPVRLKAG